MSRYELELDNTEHARLRAQAAGAGRDEIWGLAGVVPGAAVVDLGCGPAAVMLELASVVGPEGSLTGVDSDPIMVERGQAAVAAAGVDNVVVREGLAEDSGLPQGSFDCAVVRLVLIHNGRREQEIVNHAASLVRSGGRVLLIDLDSTMIRYVPKWWAPITELHDRYEDYQVVRGNDPTVGLRLPEFLESAGLEVEVFRTACASRKRRIGERGPAWAVRHAMVEEGVACADDLERWTREFEELDSEEEQPWIIGCVFMVIGRRP